MISPCISSCTHKFFFKIFSLSIIFIYFNLPTNYSIIMSSSSVVVVVDSNSSSQFQGVENNHNENVLQKHVAFFDVNKDGVIYPWETFQGFRAIGCGIGLSSVAAVFINVGLSGKTRPGKFPSLRFPIVIENIQKAKHGSDSGVYDNEGRFVPKKFEEIFSKYARTNSGSLTSEELKAMLKANREPKDFGGWVASYTEWKILYDLCKDKNGLLTRDTIRAVYDGSLFVKMASEHAASRDKAAK